MLPLTVNVSKKAMKIFRASQYVVKARECFKENYKSKPLSNTLCRQKQEIVWPLKIVCEWVCIVTKLLAQLIM